MDDRTCRIPDEAKPDTRRGEAESVYPAGSIVDPKSIQLTCTTSGLDLHDVQSLNDLHVCGAISRYTWSIGRYLFYFFYFIELRLNTNTGY